MGILKKNHLTCDFTILPNKAIVDPRLSANEFRVYCFLCSKPDGWKIYNRNIMSELRIKDSGSMAKYWKKLLQLEFISREPRFEAGALKGYDYFILEYPDVHQSGKSPIRKKPNREKTHIGKNPDHINTNLKSNTNLKINTDKKVLFSFSSQLVEIVITHLNEITKSKFRPQSKVTKDLIRARVKEGYSKDDFIKVIDNMYKAWKGSGMSVYLRPSTLFGNKFENYLNYKGDAQKPINVIKDTNYDESSEHEF